MFNLNSKNKNNKRGPTGFTLIEMLIVVAIIGILASMVMISLGPAQQKGRDARRQSDLSQVQNLLELYYTANGSYPGAPAVTDWTTLGAALQSVSNGKSLPVDPINNTTYGYCYAASSSNFSYILGTKLEVSAGSGSSTCPTNMTGCSNGGSVDPNYCLSF